MLKKFQNIKEKKKFQRLQRQFKRVKIKLASEFFKRNNVLNGWGSEGGGRGDQEYM